MPGVSAPGWRGVRLSLGVAAGPRTSQPCGPQCRPVTSQDLSICLRTVHTWPLRGSRALTTTELSHASPGSRVAPPAMLSSPRKQPPVYFLFVF